jgi:hypothetical protein
LKLKAVGIVQFAHIRADVDRVYGSDLKDEGHRRDGETVSPCRLQEMTGPEAKGGLLARKRDGEYDRKTRESDPIPPDNPKSAPLLYVTNCR